MLMAKMLAFFASNDQHLNIRIPCVANEEASDTLCFVAYISSSSCLLFPPPPPELVTELYPRRPQLVEQNALPLLWCLLGLSGGSLRPATTSLCQALLDQIGLRSLRESAASQPPTVGIDLNKLLRTMS